MIFNNDGKPRLTKFYAQIPVSTQQMLISEIFSLVKGRPSSACNFLEGSTLLGGDEVRIVYRGYATLWFCFVVDDGESALGTLDLIQAFVEALDTKFGNVCELDLIFHFDTVHAVLAECVSGGLVAETNVSAIVAAVDEGTKQQALDRSISGGIFRRNPLRSR
ncbi:Sigma-adaptin 3A [Savitreella phatthalungensis]